MKLIRILLPTLCLLYSTTWSSAPPLGRHNEAYGNGEFYLDLHFPVNPAGPLQNEPPRAVKFTGYFVVGDKTEEISGVRIEQNGKRVYRFPTSAGLFTGTLFLEKNECEPRLQFAIHGKPAGMLRAGFCDTPTSQQASL